MKADARASARYNTLIGAVGEENKKDRSLSHMMGQANVVARSKMGQVAVSHLNAPSPTRGFLFAVVAVSEMGQV